MRTDFFRHNREQLREKLRHGSLVVITGYGEVQQKHDCAAPFEQEANFYYLTGVNSPDWWYMADGISGKEYLVRPELSSTKEVFDGSLPSSVATEVSGVKDVMSRDEAMRILRTWAKTHTIVYTTEQPQYLGQMGFQLNHAQSELKKTLERTFQTVQTCNRELAELRTIKQPEEVAAIEKAVAVTAKAFENAKALLSRAHYEYEVEAEMTRVIRSSGAWGHAYSPIVAGGANSCTLHYIRNNSRLHRGELLLIDVGANVDGYAADITRTFALGKPHKRQAAVHDAVRTAEEACVAMLKPGLSFDEYETGVERVMKEALRSLGLDEGKYRTYFPHAIGHGLGLDVHDSMAGYHELRPGMVLTVEPGLYLSEEGIGVRIEDDILITDTGHRNLSGSLSTQL